MNESITELRKICQDSRVNEFYFRGWTERNLYRRISIYFTKLFLKLGISANQVTSISFFIMIIAGVFFTLGDPKYWIIGASLVYLFNILDRVDGEIARYNKSASVLGAYLDAGTYFLTWPYVLACMCFGIYNALQEVTVFIIGFLAMTSFLLYYALQGLEYRVLHEKDLLIDAIERKTDKQPIEKTFTSTLLSVGRSLCSYFSSEMTILIVSVMDCIWSSITGEHILTLGFFEVNFRYLYLTIYGISMLMAVIIRAYSNIRGGVKLQRI